MTVCFTFPVRRLGPSREDGVKSTGSASVPLFPSPADRSVGTARCGHRIPGARGGGSAASALVRQWREFPARLSRGEGRGLISSPRPSAGRGSRLSPPGPGERCVCPAVCHHPLAGTLSLVLPFQAPPFNRNISVGRNP